MKKQNCNNCIYYDLKINRSGWYSTSPHPCSNCIGQVETVNNFKEKELFINGEKITTPSTK